ncbi:protein I'm not dead yet-like [Leguminivora glycinivorella]|uniref:protein I'm not dead yet-like n=1 Tax=Leguminivora glycinivorella TaxID=1035111 RepID=UPI00200E4C95|nr:protein I'm not dead yet-like [Leguminivora glycinivorella]
MACYGVMGTGYIQQVYMCNEVLDCVGVMMLMAAVENSQIHKRAALRLLITIGCSHYRLSLVLFFSAMFLSMWIPNTVACGLLMPLVKALLQELEKMGIVDMYQTTNKTQQKPQKLELSRPKPTDFTVFYFLGIAYSCSIGGMGTLHGSQANQIFKEYSELLFPKLGKITFPQFMLLTLPGVLVTETLLYIWMNSFFLKIFRSSDVAIPTGLTEEEARYIKTLLQNQYTQMGRIKFHDIVVATAVVLTVALQMLTSTLRLASGPRSGEINMHVRVSAPTIFCILLLFIIPSDLEFLKFFKKRNYATHRRLPTAPSKACLNWTVVKDNMMWGVLFTVGGSCVSFEALKRSGMTAEFGRALQMVCNWPSPVVVLVVIIFSKVLTEFASNSCVVYAVLPEIAELSIKSYTHPHYLMLAATLASSMAAHLAPSTPCLTMVSQYVHISTWRMMSAGVGPSVIAVIVTWFTVTLWSKVIISD